MKDGKGKYHIYPIDVHGSVNYTSNVVAGQTHRLKMFGWIGLNIFLMFVLPRLIPSVVGVTLLLLLLNLCVGSIYVRFFVFNESELIKEFEGYKNDSFRRFYHLRRENIKTITFSKGYSATVYEYNNGNNMVTLRLSLGSNNLQNVTNNTEDLYNNISNTLNKFGYETLYTLMPENVVESPEYKELRDKVNNCTNSKIKECMYNIVRNLEDVTKQTAMVQELYITIKSKTSAQRFQLEVVLANLIESLLRRKTSVRSFKFLNPRELKEFYQAYYGLEFIDLDSVTDSTVIKTVNQSYIGAVRLYKIKTTDGKWIAVDRAPVNNIGNILTTIN